MDTILSCIPQFYDYLRNTYVVENLNIMSLLAMVWGVALIFFVLLPYGRLDDMTDEL